MMHLPFETTHHVRLLDIGLPGGWEWIVLLVLGLLIFGRRLPEVGRSLGRGIVEFKKGIKGIEDEIEAESSKSPSSSSASQRSRQELADQSAEMQSSPQRESRKQPVGVEGNPGDE
jgi:sec-independent protein translocase protein TatA